MIQYIYLRNNLPWQGTHAELRALIQNWRKELQLNLNDSVDISFRVQVEGVTACLNIPNGGCDTKEINLSKLCLKEVDQNSRWSLLASGAEYLGENATLNSVRVTNEVTGEEVLWKR